MNTTFRLPTPTVLCEEMEERLRKFYEDPVVVAYGASEESATIFIVQHYGKCPHCRELNR